MAEGQYLDGEKVSRRQRLRVAGFKGARVDVNPYAFRFFARR